MCASHSFLDMHSDVLSGSFLSLDLFREKLLKDRTQNWTVTWIQWVTAKLIWGIIIRYYPAYQSRGAVCTHNVVCCNYAAMDIGGHHTFKSYEQIMNCESNNIYVDRSWYGFFRICKLSTGMLCTISSLSVLQRVSCFLFLSKWLACLKIYIMYTCCSKMRMDVR